MTTNKTIYWARKCSATGEGMNEGWCFGDGAYYAKYYEDAIAELRRDYDYIVEGFTSTEKEMLPNYLDKHEWSVVNENLERGEISDEALLYMAYVTDYVYWTEWDSSDAQYQEANGTLTEI